MVVYIGLRASRVPHPGDLLEVGLFQVYSFCIHIHTLTEPRTAADVRQSSESRGGEHCGHSDSSKPRKCILTATTTPLTVIDLYQPEAASSDIFVSENYSVESKELNFMVRGCH